MQPRVTKNAKPRKIGAALPPSGEGDSVRFGPCGLAPLPLIRGSQRRISDTLCRLATGEWRKVVEETVSLREALRCSRERPEPVLSLGNLEMLLDLDDRLHAILGFLLAVFFIEIEVERAVGNAARIGRVEIVGKVGPDVGPFANDVLVVGVEIDPFRPNRLCEFDLAASDGVDIDGDREIKRRTRRHE